jgi:hypothetical protein
MITWNDIKNKWKYVSASELDIMVQSYVRLRSRGYNSKVGEQEVYDWLRQKGHVRGSDYADGIIRHPSTLSFADVYTNQEPNMQNPYEPDTPAYVLFQQYQQAAGYERDACATLTQATEHHDKAKAKTKAFAEAIRKVTGKRVVTNVKAG